MKPIFKKVLLILLVLSTLLAVAACSAKEEPLVGAPVEAADSSVTPELAAYLEEATRELDTVYTPIKLISTQVVAGTNYKFLCEANGAQQYVTVYVDLDKNASILEITDVE